MGLPVTTVASGGLPIVDVTATAPKLGLAVTEAARGIAVTKVAAGKPGMAATFVPVEGGGSSGFTPADLGVVVRSWYKFDALTGANGDPQSTLTDSSGNGFTLTQAGTTRGTLAAADLNGKNTLRFTAASSQRYPMLVSMLSSATAASYYCVLKVVSAAVANGTPEWGTGAASYCPFSDGQIYDGFGSSLRKTAGTPTGALTSYRIISCYSALNDWALYVDGGTGGSGGGTTPLFTTVSNTVAWAGANQNLGANTGLTPFDGWYAELIYCNAKQTTTDRQKMEGYLANKWGLTGNLSASHPYKSAAP